MSVVRFLGHYGVRPDMERYQKERGEEISKYVKAMRKEAEKLESRLEDLGFGGGRRGGAVTELLDESLEGVEKSGEIIDNLPRFVPGEFHDIQDDTKSAIEKLDKEYQEKLTEHMGTYTEGLAKKATAVGKSGFNDAATTLTERVDSIGDDTGKFLEVLGLGE